jgi:hypothetical protein
MNSEGDLNVEHLTALKDQKEKCVASNAWLNLKANDEPKEVVRKMSTIYTFLSICFTIACFSAADGNLTVQFPRRM